MLDNLQARGWVDRSPCETDKRRTLVSLLPAGQAHFFWNGTFSEAEKREICRFSGNPSLNQLYRLLLRTPEPAGIKDFLKIDQTYYLSDDILAKCDRMSMAHSVEVRPPFLDDRIVNQFALFSVMNGPLLRLDTFLESQKKGVRRLIVPASLKWEVRDKLDQANVTERVLFPGLDGLSRWLRRYYSPRPP